MDGSRALVSPFEQDGDRAHLSPSRETVRTRAARTVVEQLVTRVRGGSLSIIGEPGHDSPARPAAIPTVGTIDVRLDVRDDRFYERLLRDGSVGLGESYADGWWNTDDLTGLLRVALRSLRPTHALRDRAHRIATPLLDPVSRLRRPSPERDVRQVRAHYDLGNEFFQRLLDDTMAYSCAIFERPDTTLVEASRAKFDRIAHLLDLRPGDRLLEIGTGWGGFALHAAQHYGVSVTTTTVSARQYEFVQSRVADAGLGELVTVLDRDYRDVEGTYDKAVAIEMIEAVDWRDYETFFRCISERLTPDGVLAMQAIVVPDSQFDRLKRHTDFIKAAIFPGGCLPSPQALERAAEPYGFRQTQQDEFGTHYAETLRRWRRNLEMITPELVARPQLGLDHRFARLWDFYFSYCEAGFDEGYIDVIQSLYAKSPSSVTHASSTSWDR